VIYQRALGYEIELQKVVFARAFEMPIYHKQKQVGARRVDFLVESNICVELKAQTKIAPVQLAQAINYLEAFNLEIGLLINFGNTKFEVHRLQNKKFKTSQVS
jgi:GxxExxY protein